MIFDRSDRAGDDNTGQITAESEGVGSDGLNAVAKEHVGK